MALFFSQTREDPAIELKALDLVKELENTEKEDKILLIGSGGDTVLTLMGSTSSEKLILDVIDTNLEQLNLLKLKLDLIDKFELNEYLDRITNGIKSREELEKYQNNFPDLIEELKNGINQNGRFEILFQDLVKCNYNYQKLFNKEYLARLFGNNAVKHSKEFINHFMNVLDTYKKKYLNPEENYFYYQILFNSYPSASDRPIYFNHFDQIHKFTPLKI